MSADQAVEHVCEPCAGGVHARCCGEGCACGVVVTFFVRNREPVCVPCDHDRHADCWRNGCPCGCLVLFAIDWEAVERKAAL